jgi:hypothetical protein
MLFTSHPLFDHPHGHVAIDVYIVMEYYEHFCYYFCLFCSYILLILMLFDKNNKYDQEFRRYLRTEHN